MAKITRKQIMLFVLLFIIAVSGYLIYDLSKSSITPYMTVSELIENSNTMIGRNIQIRGRVEKNSLQDSGMYVQFSIYDEEASIKVIYTGSIVPGFKEENEVVLIGSLNSNGNFEAEKMILKCPSKYEEFDEQYQFTDQYN
jgi:cytochrome c-type biogenesis protein CcmE